MLGSQSGAYSRYCHYVISRRRQDAVRNMLGYFMRCLSAKMFSYRHEVLAHGRLSARTNMEARR